MKYTSTAKAMLGATLVLLSCGMTMAPALAHGNKQHAKPAFDPASAEQKVFGIAGDPQKATRTIKVAMTDNMRFVPDNITVRQGETVKFVVANRGRMMHEMVIGTMEDLKEHDRMMKKFPEMEHDEPHMSHVKPGTRQELVWTFNRPGDFHFACLIPGHFDAGMIGKIKVVVRS
ncbi:cupredoxin family protein [Noviherbaspirillum agri]